MAGAPLAEQIAHVGSAVARAHALSGILRTVLDETVGTLGACLAHVHLADLEQRTLELVASQGLPTDLRARLSRVSFDAPLLEARAASERTPQSVSEISQLDVSQELTRELASRIPCESIISLPLLACDRLVGVLTLGFPVHRDFARDERIALETCAEMFSFSIANAAAYEEERRMHALFEAVGNATVTIASEFSLMPALQAIVDEARQVVGAQYAALGVALTEVGPFTAWVFSGMTTAQQASIGGILRSTGIQGCAVAPGRILRIPDGRAALGGFQKSNPPIVSLLGIPIRHGDRTVGELFLANKLATEEFAREDEQAMALLAAHAAAALGHSRLLEQLERERARFVAIMESSPHAVHFVEAGTGRVTLNRRSVELGGQADVVTWSDYKGQLLTPDGKVLPKADWPGQRVLRGERFDTQEMVLRRPDGTEVPLLVGAAPVIRSDGHLEGAIVVYEDVSMLKELQRLREEWAAIVAHDLRQPLSILTTSVAMLQRLAERPDPASLRKGLERAQKAVGVLSRMIDDLSDMSRIEAKCLDLEGRPVDLEVLVRECVDHQRFLSPDRVIDMHCTGSLPKVEVDPIRIEQVVGNLIGNALKYSDPGTPVRVEVRSVDGELRVTVTNRGPAIAPEDLPKVFDRYYRTAHARSSAKRGMGLGLYISKGVIEAHGGRIWAESQPGETIFQFSLPASEEPVLH
jgi:signal transduction histidine kinase/GAF domain-containing protein